MGRPDHGRRVVSDLSMCDGQLRGRSLRLMTYVELHARSAFSFLRGGSSPEQIAERAAELQIPAVALCDRDGVYGAPRFFAHARESGLRPIVGAELTMEDQTVLPVLVQS